MQAVQRQAGSERTASHIDAFSRRKRTQYDVKGFTDRIGEKKKEIHLGIC